MKEIIQSVSLFFKDGSSDKEYNVVLQGEDGYYTVDFSYGRRGNAVNAGTKTMNPTNREQAFNIYNKLVAEKTAKGYCPEGNAKPFSSLESAGESTGLFPALLTPIDLDELEPYFENDDWMMQEKLDGKRIIVQVKDGKVTASNRRTLKVGIPKEIEESLSKWGDCILDGELIGSTYHVFDIIESGGKDMRVYPCGERFRRLTAYVVYNPPNNIKLVKCAISENDKRGLYTSMLHKEGVVLKHKSAPYASGKGTNQLKCKFWSDTSVSVIAINDKASIKIGMMDGDKMVPVGNVTIIGHDTPNVGDIVDVTYLYAYEGGSLYQPKYRGIRDDHDVDQISSLKYKSEIEE